MRCFLTPPPPNLISKYQLIKVYSIIMSSISILPVWYLNNDLTLNIQDLSECWTWAESKASVCRIMLRFTLNSTLTTIAIRNSHGLIPYFLITEHSAGLSTVYTTFWEIMHVCVTSSNTLWWKLKVVLDLFKIPELLTKSGLMSPIYLQWILLNYTVLHFILI